MFLDAQHNAYSTGVMFKANMDIAPDRVFNENGDVVAISPTGRLICSTSITTFIPV